MSPALVHDMFHDGSPPPEQRRTGTRVVLALAALTAGVAAGAVVLVLASSDRAGPAPAPAALKDVRGTELAQRAVVRERRPGYIAWTGAWTMPDGSLMMAYTRATGPVDPDRRERAPQDLLDAFGVESWPAGRDFWGLDLSVEYLRSPDGGASWNEARSDRFEAISPIAYTPQPTIALDDGTLVRRVNGDDLRQDPNIPHTAFLQYLAPGAQDWGEPQLLLDPAEYTYQITRLRKLADGRLVATGNAWDVPASVKPPERDSVPSRFLLMVSDDQGSTWREALTVPQGTPQLPGNEWDTAELASGDLLAVMRTATADGTPVVKQAILRRQGEGWVLSDLRDAPFPVTGHPELLRTSLGPIISFATSGAQYTQDGRTWTPLPFPGGAVLRSHYYPRAIEADDGTIHVFSHLGADDPYPMARQAIVQDTFRLLGDPVSR